MPRSQRQVPNVYFGRPGALVTLPWPVNGIDAPYDLQAYDFLTGQGMHQVSRLAQGTRLYTVNWNAMHIDTYSRLEEFLLGTNGQGPWAFIDPSRPNLLLPNQAASGSVFNDARHWTTNTGAANEGQVSASTLFVNRARATRSIRWFFTVAAAVVPVLRFTSTYRNWFGVPVVPTLPYAFSIYARADGTVDSDITTGVRLRWLDAAGAQISESSGGNISVLAAWQRLTVTGNAPANAAYVEPRVITVGSSITTGASLYLDSPLLEQDSVVNDWAPGTGLRPVQILNLPEAVPFETRMRTGLALTLREIVT
jgi:hypothetical protein